MKVDIEYKEIFNKKNIITHIAYFSLIMSLIYGIMFYTMISFNKVVYKGIESRIINSGISMLDACIVLNCKTLTIKKDGNIDVYKVNEEGELSLFKSVTEDKYNKYTNHFDFFTSNLNIIMTLNDSEMVIDNGVYSNIIFNTFIMVTIFMAIPSLLLYVYIVTRLNIRQRLNKGLYKSELETRLQRDLTEVLHHELGVPISIIETNVDELIYRLYPCKIDKTKICRYATLAEDRTFLKCDHCINSKRMTDNDRENILLFSDLRFAVDRVKSILKIISNSKKIRFSNGTVPIFAICENIVSSINSFKLRKISADYINADIIKKYSVIAELGNGNILNILHVLMNNSIEAGANKVTIESKLVNDNTLKLTITDNGIGVRDSKGKPIIDKHIFDYGYTTKDESCSRFNSKSIGLKILDFLGFTISSNKPKRGIGLFISKSIIQKVGGDIILKETSETGTTFELIIPVKKTRL